MGKYLAPLWVFVGGMGTSLVAYLFLDSLGNAATQLQADTAAIAPVFWNFTWVSNPDVVKFAVLIGLLLGTLFLTAIAFLRVR